MRLLQHRKKKNILLLVMITMKLFDFKEPKNTPRTTRQDDFTYPDKLSAIMQDNNRKKNVK